MKLSLVHLSVEFSNAESNFGQIQRSYIQAVNSGSNLVIFPEFSITGYCVLSSTITTEVIGCNTRHLEEFHNRIWQLVKQHQVPMFIGSFAYNQNTDSGTVSAYYFIDQDSFQLIKEKRQHSKLPHPYSLTFKYGGTVDKQVTVGQFKFNTLICSETMDDVLVNESLEKECDILLNPSAFGEVPPYTNYPIPCSPENQSKLDKLIVLTPNQTINTDKYNMGRTMIRQGNDVLFQLASLQTTLIHMESDTNAITTDTI